MATDRIDAGPPSDAGHPASTSTNPSAAEVLAQAIGRLGVTPDPTTVEDYLALVEAAADLEAHARGLLHDAVASARGAGATWSALGTTLGMTKQGVQKRFAVDAVPTTAGHASAERILGPVTAFTEMAELALAGRYGWHSVEFGPFYHRVVRSGSQWEHTRVSMLGGRGKTLRADGWQVIGSSFPNTYLKRDLGIPALDEGAAEPT